MSVKSMLKAMCIIGQGKSFCRWIFLESSCARKETVDIDILKASKNGDRKIMQPMAQKWGSGTSSASSDEHLPKQ